MGTLLVANDLRQKRTEVTHFRLHPSINRTLLSNSSWNDLSNYTIGETARITIPQTSFQTTVNIVIVTSILFSAAVSILIIVCKYCCGEDGPCGGNGEQNGDREDNNRSLPRTTITLNNDSTHTHAETALPPRHLMAYFGMQNIIHSNRAIDGISSESPGVHSQPMESGGVQSWAASGTGAPLPQNDTITRACDRNNAEEPYARRDCYHGLLQTPQRQISPQQRSPTYQCESDMPPTYQEHLRRIESPPDDVGAPPAYYTLYREEDPLNSEPVLHSTTV